MADPDVNSKNKPTNKQSSKIIDLKKGVSLILKESDVLFLDFFAGEKSMNRSYKKNIITLMITVVGLFSPWLHAMLPNPGPGTGLPILLHYGDVIKIKNSAIVPTTLRSLGKTYYHNYNAPNTENPDNNLRTSYQMSVSGSRALEQTEAGADEWKIKAAHGQTKDDGAIVENGDVIRLENVKYKKNLHSHWLPAPGLTYNDGYTITNNNGPREFAPFLTNAFINPDHKPQEVTLFGNQNGEGDGNDNWTLQYDGQKIKLRHGQDRYLYLPGLTFVYDPQDPENDEKEELVIATIRQQDLADFAFRETEAQQESTVNSKFEQLAKYLGKGSAQGYSPLLADGKTDILPGLSRYWFWTSSVTPHDFGYSYPSFISFNGFIGSEFFTSGFERLAVRCVPR